MAEIREQLKKLWNRFNPRQRWIILGSALVLFFAILAASYFYSSSKPEYVPLFTDMETKDAGDVAARLQEMKVPFEIIANGTAIAVPAKDVYKIRLELARLGLPRGSKGFEIFDEAKFGTTEFQNKVKYLQALQGELTRTIEQMAEVEKARVHIVLPEDSLYKKNEKPATASIMLKLKPKTQLTKEQVKGIVNLTANSIRGLKPESITVVDSFARVLNENIDGDPLNPNVSITQTELARKKQSELQKALESLLEQALGPNKAAVRVSVELTFDQRTLDKQTFEPVVDDKGILRSSQENTESFKGTSPQPGGPPGTTSNIPGYVTGNAPNQSASEKKETIRNYEINETKEKIVVAPGSVKRVSVAVLVDASVSKAQQESITKVVASAAGINMARGDSISVEAIPFSTEIADKIRREEQEQAQEQQRAQWTKIGVGVGAVLLIAGIGFWVLKRRQEEEIEVLSMETATPIEEIAVESIREISPQEKERNEDLEAVETLAKAKPEEVALLLKTWLAEE